MEYYEICTFEVCTFVMKTKDGFNAEEIWYNCTNKDMNVVVSYCTYELAKEYYDNVPVSVIEMSGYYLHTCKVLVGGQKYLIELDIPDRAKED